MTAAGLKTVTFNLFHDYPRCRHAERRLAIVEDALAEEAPDFVLLQEVPVSVLYGDFGRCLVDGLRARGISYELHYAAANGSLARGEVFEEGSAILSRHPIVETAVRELAADRPVERELHGHRFVEHRIAVSATVRLAGEELTLVGTHLTDAGSDPRRAQVEDLLRFVESQANGRPVILGGDFNARPDAGEIALLAAHGLVDLGDPGPTNDPEDRDLESARETASQRIDYLFAGGEEAPRPHAARLFLASPVEVAPGRWLWASDHNGIVAETLSASPRSPRRSR